MGVMLVKNKNKNKNKNQDEKETVKAFFSE
jgi:hypothetical protein